MLVGLISDTHGVLCQEVRQALAGADIILHAGDVGHHGGHHDVLAALAAVAPVLAVRGNVDDRPEEGGDEVGSDIVVVEEVWAPPAAGAGSGGAALGTARRLLLPGHRLVVLAGWRVLVTHIVGQPPERVEPAVKALIQQHRPHIVVFGHSHKHVALSHGGIMYYNPGSAGPARFTLPRTAALLELPPRRQGTGDTAPLAAPTFKLIRLAQKAPPRLSSAKRPADSTSQAAAAAAGPRNRRARAGYPLGGDTWAPEEVAAAAAATAMVGSGAASADRPQDGGDAPTVTAPSQTTAVGSATELAGESAAAPAPAPAPAPASEGRMRRNSRNRGRVAGASATPAHL